MATQAISRGAGFEIQISPDCLSATLYVAAGADVSAATVIAVLREMKLADFDEGRVIETLENRNGAAVCAVVASGVAATEEKPPRIDYRIPIADGANRTIARVEAGQVLATLSPAIAGVNGRDVFGREILPPEGEALDLGRGIALIKGELVSTARGNFRLNLKRFSVEPLLELLDSDARIASVDFDGDAFTKGSISEGKILQISGALTVGGAMEAIQLKTGGDVHVRGGIIGRNKGKFVVGADLRCRFISGGLFIVAGDLLVQSEIMGSRIDCIGRVSVARGPISGGFVAANGGVSCSVLGNASGTPTIIEAGEGTACLSFVAAKRAQIKANQKRVSDVRKKIEPLLKHLKYLSPPQKEKATELLYEAGELDAQTQIMVAGLEDEARLIRQNARAEIEVATAAMAGVKIRLSGVETTLKTAFKGPFTLTTRKAGARSEIVLIDGLDHSATVLPSQAVKVEERGGESRGSNEKAA